MKKMYKDALRIFIYQLLIIVVPLLVLAIPGRLLDKHLDTAPRYLIIAILISLAITVSLSFILTKKITAQLDQIAKEKKEDNEEDKDKKDQ